MLDEGAIGYGGVAVVVEGFVFVDKRVVGVINVTYSEEVVVVVDLGVVVVVDEGVVEVVVVQAVLVDEGDVVVVDDGVLS